MLNTDLPIVPLITILRSTDTFSEAAKLGEGGFGSVYKVFIIWICEIYSLLLPSISMIFLSQTFIREFYQMEDK